MKWVGGWDVSRRGMDWRHERVYMVYTRRLPEFAHENLSKVAKTLPPFSPTLLAHRFTNDDER